MTAEAILKAEQELKVTAAAPKINRAGPVVPEAVPAEPAPAVTKPDAKPPGLLSYKTMFLTTNRGHSARQGERPRQHDTDQGEGGECGDLARRRRG